MVTIGLTQITVENRRFHSESGSLAKSRVHGYSSEYFRLTAPLLRSAWMAICRQQSLDCFRARVELLPLIDVVHTTTNHSPGRVRQTSDGQRSQKQSICAT